MRWTSGALTFGFVAWVVSGVAPAGANSPARMSEQQVRSLIRRIEQNTRQFHKTVDRALEQSSLNDRPDEDRINESLRNLVRATDRLESRFKDDGTAAQQTEAVLLLAAAIQRDLRRNPLGPRVESDWAVLRADFDQLGSAYGVSWSQRGVRGRLHRVSDHEIRDLLTRIEKNSDRFERSLDKALDRSSLDGTGAEKEFERMVQDFEVATDRLRGRYGDRDTAEPGVQEVLQRARLIDRTLRRYDLTTQAHSDWRYVRGDLEELARAYNFRWRW